LTKKKKTTTKAWQPSRILFTAEASNFGRRMRVEINEYHHDLCLREYRLFLRLCWARVVGEDVDKWVDDGWIHRDELFPGEDHYCGKVLWIIRETFKATGWPVYERDIFERVRLLADPGAVVVDPDLLKAGDEEIRIMAVRMIRV